MGHSESRRHIHPHAAQAEHIDPSTGRTSPVSQRNSAVCQLYHSRRQQAFIKCLRILYRKIAMKTTPRSHVETAQAQIRSPRRKEHQSSGEGAPITHAHAKLPRGSVFFAEMRSTAQQYASRVHKKNIRRGRTPETMLISPRNLGSNLRKSLTDSGMPFQSSHRRRHESHAGPMK